MGDTPAAHETDYLLKDSRKQALQIEKDDDKFFVHSKKSASSPKPLDLSRTTFVAMAITIGILMVLWMVVMIGMTLKTSTMATAAHDSLEPNEDSPSSTNTMCEGPASNSSFPWMNDIKTGICGCPDNILAELYLNWDEKSHRELILSGSASIAEQAKLTHLSKQKPLIIFDEIHKMPNWKNYLKNAVKKNKRKRVKDGKILRRAALTTGRRGRFLTR